MVDISKWLNNDGHRRNECYRATAKDNEYWQSYTLFNGGDDCENFLPIPQEKPRSNEPER